MRKIKASEVLALVQENALPACHVLDADDDDDCAPVWDTCRALAAREDVIDRIGATCPSRWDGMRLVVTG